MSTDATGARYKDKVTIVTGGSRGIGRACVEVFVKYGSKVVFCDLREEMGLELEAKLKNGFPGEAKFVTCDVTKEEDIKRLIQTAVETYGRIDCLINNAGTTQGVKSIDTLTADEFRQLNEVNVIAPFQITKMAIPYLRKTKGNIINMCSMSGIVGQGNSTAYTPSKAALIGITKTLAVDESKYGVRVNGVSPGPVHTQLLEDAASTAKNPDKYIEYRTKHQQAASGRNGYDGLRRIDILIRLSAIVTQQFMGRLGQPEEIALACLYLAADATYSTGLNLYASGGAELDYGFKANIDQFL